MPSEHEATRRWLTDIRHRIVMAEGFAAGTIYATFKDDTHRLYAVIRCLEIISEASWCSVCAAQYLVDVNSKCLSDPLAKPNRNCVTN